jgi:hypothetical protein
MNRRAASFALILGACVSGGLQAETRALIVAGLGGTQDYDLEFARHAKRLADHLQEVSGDVTLLIGDSAGTDSVRTAFEALKGRLVPTDSLLFAYVGHGSWDGERFKFNVPGRDFTAGDLAGWLESARSTDQLVIVTGASSGAVQDVLAAEHRTVITATRSGEQRNATVFGGFFTAALEDDAADVDKDKKITVVEAFRYAESGIERYYSGEGEMTTEHPVTRGPEPVLVLAVLVLDSQPEVDPALTHLITRRDALEHEIADLKSNKAAYETDDYFAELQRLLLELAMINSQLEPADGVPEP